MAGSVSISTDFGSWLFVYLHLNILVVCTQFFPSKITKYLLFYFNSFSSYTSVVCLCHIIIIIIIIAHWIFSVVYFV